jgi:nucleoside-diphosphate-sugar epimerase
MSDGRRIFVTGAGGFIGGRVVEVLHGLGVGEVRAGMRRWATGARIGRLPVELVRCDIRDPDQVREALADVTHIVHCAVGEHSSTVDGTRVLLAGAQDAGVKRFVHLSTVDVYGTPEGEVDETRDLTITGRAYGDSKIAAEEACKAAASRGVPVTILRPTLVHGPFSATWTVAYAQRLQKRPWLVAEPDAQGTCNLVFVDDVVGAVLSAFDADTAPGEAFNVNGPERPTWNEYFQRLNEAMGLPPLQRASPTGARLKASAVLPFRKTAKFMVTHFQDQIMKVAQSSALARNAMVRAESMIKTTPVPSEFAVYSRRTSYSSDKAARELGWRPRFTLADSLPPTAAWLEDGGFIERDSV